MLPSSIPYFSTYSIFRLSRLKLKNVLESYFQISYIWIGYKSYIENWCCINDYELSQKPDLFIYSDIMIHTCKYVGVSESYLVFSSLSCTEKLYRGW